MQILGLDGDATPRDRGPVRAVAEREPGAATDGDSRTVRVSVIQRTRYITH